MSIEQISNLPNLYVNNLQISYTSTKRITMAAGAARDSTNVSDLVLSAPTVINGSVNGVNGLDTGSLANSTWYAVYVIGSALNPDSYGTATLLSTSATQPKMPFNYDLFRLIGWVKTDGSANFLKFYVAGNSHERVYLWDSVITVKSNGAGNTAFQALSLSSAMPSTSKLVYLQTSLIANSAGNKVNFRTTGSSSVSNIGTSSPVTTIAMLNMINGITNDSQSIDWNTSENADTLAIWVCGFTDYI